MHLLDTPKQRSVRNALMCYFLALCTMLTAILFMHWASLQPSENNDVIIVVTAMLVTTHITIQLLQQASRWLHPKQPCKYRPHS